MIWLKKRSLLLCILLLGLLLRVYNLGAYAYWFDEKLSLTNAMGLAYSDVYSDPDNPRTFSSEQIWAGKNLLSPAAACVQDDSGNGVLHTYAVRAWVSIAGHSEGQARLLELFLGLAAVLVLYKLGKLLFEQKTGLLAAFLLAIHPFWVLHNQELRAYSLAVLLTLSATYLFCRLAYSDDLSGKKRAAYWFLYSLCLPLGFMSHYLCVLIFAIHGLFSLLVKRWKLAFCLIAAAAFGGLFCGLWLYAYGLEGFAYMAMRNGRFVKMAAENPAMQTGLVSALGGSLEVLIPISGNLLASAGFRLRELLPLLVGFGLLFLPLFSRKGLFSTKFPILALLGLLAGCGLALSALLAWRAGHIVSFSPRYSLWCLPYLLLLAAYCLRLSLDFSRKGLQKAYWSFWLIFGVVQLYSLVLVWEDADKKRQPDGYAAIAAQILQNASPQDSIFYNDNRDAAIFNLYLPADNRLPQQCFKKYVPLNEDCIVWQETNPRKEHIFPTNFDRWED